MNQAEGQPQIRVEQVGRDGAATGAATGAAPTAAGARMASNATTPIAGAGGLTATRLHGMNVYSSDNQKLGDIDRVVQTTDNKAYLVVGFGGILGLGERKVAIPVEQVMMRGDRLVVSGLTNDQLKALPAYDAGTRYRDAEGAFSPMFGATR